jgi:predicted nucleotidyltransferase
MARPETKARGRRLKLPDDFRDLLICLSDEGVDFVIVGGFALAHHGYVRATKDIDLFLRPAADNAAKVVRALKVFGAPLEALQLGAEDFTTEGQVIQLGVPPLRIDLLTGLSGVDFATASAQSGALDVQGRAVRFIGLDALLANKRASGRLQDLADVAALEKLGRSGLKNR